jgi:hypothetical protein
MTPEFIFCTIRDDFSTGVKILIVYLFDFYVQ